MDRTRDEAETVLRLSSITKRFGPLVANDAIGFDLTLSPSKSVSLIWALGSDNDARQVEEALYAARDEVERYLESTACFVRRGHAGAVVEPGKGLFGAVFMPPLRRGSFAPRDRCLYLTRANATWHAGGMSRPLTTPRRDSVTPTRWRGWR